ncbi:phosphoglucosamine mutase [Stenomitos frigidus]|uniref:Phosphoglucosamine mutase n=1 Tax=Stenomitos frigidus ULC18 TaxID=2107698 RepID=A0A2T1ECJ8_9CYAN|nr:phosphoglucosamine mutase [Stenomitos frigidus]PSB30450.1 phosphoglucosamine mutase [Stenomitos frigidus ULC18]
MVQSPVRTQPSESVGLVPLQQSSTPEVTRSSLASSPLVDDAVATSLLVGSGWGGLNLPESRLFGTDGIRGRAGDLLTAPLALQIGFWAGHILRSQTDSDAPVIIGQDSRNSGSMLAMALSAGLNAAGVEVWNLGLCPTPAVAHLTSTLGAIGGVMISASHNPPEDNGIKFFGASGSKLSLSVQEHIEAALRGNDTAGLVSDVGAGTGSYRCGQNYYRSELLSDYLASIQNPLLAKASALPLQGMRVVLDLAWGAAVHLAPQAFRALGATVICLHDQPDGDRINVNCGSTHLATLQASVQEHHAALGFAFDGDADRVLAVDASGRVVDGDYILYLWGQSLRQAQQLPGDTIVATVMSNLGFERAWEKQGGKLIRAAVGDQYVHAEMVRHGSVLGGEQSGHILCSHYSVSGDGLLTALHLAALVQRSGASLSTLVDRSFQTYPQRLQNVRVDDRARRLDWQNCDPLRQVIAQAEAAMGDQGRVLVRASGTEPLIRVMVEAVTADLVTHWTDTIVSVVRQHLVVKG